MKLKYLIATPHRRRNALLIVDNSVFIHSALQLSLSCQKPGALSALSKYAVIMYEICSVNELKCATSF